MKARADRPPDAVVAASGILLVATLLVLVFIPISGAPVASPTTGPPTGPLFPPGSSPVLFPSYSEKPVTLPGFDALYGLVLGNNCRTTSGSCFTGGADYSQVPVLSSDSNQPFGVYYVNNFSELVEYAFASGSVRVVASVTVLDQAWADYGGMLRNEFFIAYGYDEALFFGTETPTASYVSVETVNLSTGSVHLLDTQLPKAPVNQQPVLVGNDLVVVVSSGGQCTRTADCTADIAGFNLDNGTAWPAASNVPFFEANNIYWLAQKHQLINVEAHGSRSDALEQWNESLNAFGEPVFSLATTVTVDSGIEVNWANGIGYNATSGRIAYSSGGGGYSATYVLRYDGSGLLTTTGMSRYTAARAGVLLTPRTFNGQQYVYTSDYVMGGFVNGTQFLFDPWNGSTVPTNEPFTNLTPSVCDGSCFLGTYGPNPDYRIDFHASLMRNDPFWSVVVAYTSGP